MRIDGSWRLCDDGIVRPVVRAEVRTDAGAWLAIFLLVDIGADRTVFSAGVLETLGVPRAPAKENLGGVGGQAESVIVNTSIRVIRESGAHVLFHGDFAAFTDPKSLDMSVLGRDLTNLFAVIVDRPQEVVCLIGQKHRYAILEG